MILIKRLKGDRVVMLEVVEVVVDENNRVTYCHYLHGEYLEQSAAPGKGECVDVIDGGRRLMSVTYNKILWYGAAPK